MSKNGYKSMRLNGKTIYIHHLVAAHFLKNPDNKNEINHKDCNPSNNCVDNLEWVTHKENCNYKDHGENISAALKKWNKVHEHSKPMLGKKHSEVTRKRISEMGIKKRDVMCISTNFNLISSYESVWEASKNTGIPTCSIRNACCRRFKLCRGNIWRYKDDCEYEITI